MFGSIKVTVNKEKHTLIVNRQQWEAMPMLLRQKMKADMEEEYGAALEMEFIEGDPHDDDELRATISEVDHEPVEVDNLLVPDNMRVVQAHYPNGGVEVAVLTKRGWVRVLESGEHMCGMPSPYFDEAPPSVITMLSKLPKEGLGDTSTDMMDDYTNSPKFRRNQMPMFLDTSDSNESIDVPEPEGAEEEGESDGPAAELAAKLAQLVTGYDPDGMNPGEAAKRAFETMYDGTILIEEYGRKQGLNTEGMDPFKQLFMGYLKSCMNFDRNNPEEAWPAFDGAVETLAESPQEYTPIRNATKDDFIIIKKAGKELTATFRGTPEYRSIAAAVNHGKPFDEWAEDFYVLRMNITTMLREVLAGVEERRG